MKPVERVFANISSRPLPRAGDRVTLADGRTGIVDTAKPTDDFREAKCTIVLDREEPES